MARPHPLRIVRPRPVALPTRAAADLHFIRETMESASTLTSVPGKGMVAMGVLACATAAFASMQSSSLAWLAVWLACASIAAPLGCIALVRKSRATGATISRGVGAKFVRSLCPAFAAGALLTFALALSGRFEILPGVWLLLYGAGLTTAGAYSVRIVRAMGAGFMALGALALFTPAALGDLWLALGFAGLHVVCGAIIWRNNGG